MKTEWDYTNLADAYLKRPDYSTMSIQDIIKIAGLKAGDHACDIGAGTAHLTLKLAEFDLNIVAVEPNDAMRRNGMIRTEKLKNVRWVEGTGEQTGQKDNSFDLVTFGSSFNVTNRELALKETARILKSHGWFACMWNHRDLNDPIQNEIENIIKSYNKDYNYGTRREDQTEVIEASRLFGEVHKIKGSLIHKQSVEDCIEAWRSHATLNRQMGSKFHQVIDDIEKALLKLNKTEIDIPYTTRIWLAQKTIKH